jgi:hypothetical protein
MQLSLILLIIFRVFGKNQLLSISKNSTIIRLEKKYGEDTDEK